MTCDLSMPAGQAVEIIVGRRSQGTTYAIHATYEGDTPGRPLTDMERIDVAVAAKLLADALGDTAVDEDRLNDAVEKLHRYSLIAEGEPRLRLADGRVIAAREVTYRARLTTS